MRKRLEPMLPLSPETKEFFDVCFDPKYDGHINISILGSRVKTVTVAQVSVASELLKTTKIAPSKCYYIAKNTFNCGKRRINNLLSLNNIVIDVDCHDDKKDYDDIDRKAGYLISSIYSDLVFEDKCPAPTYFHKTGRGLQIWWSLQPNYAPLYREIYDDVVSYFIDLITQTIEHNKDLHSFSVDLGASRNDAGFVRLPNTYSRHTKMLTELVAGSKMRYNLFELFELIENKAKPVPKPTHIRYEDGDDLARLGAWRMSMLERLQSLRKDHTGTRDFFCLFYYLACRLVMQHEDAFRKLAAFNSRFSEPLSDRELENTICAAKHTNYSYTNKAIYDALEVTEDEREILCLDESMPKPKKNHNKARDARRRAARNERNKKILDLRKDGKSYSEIGRRLGLDRRTVRKVIAENEEIYAKKQEREREKQMAKAEKKQEIQRRRKERRLAAMERRRKIEEEMERLDEEVREMVERTLDGAGFARALDEWRQKFFGEPQLITRTADPPIRGPQRR